MRWIIRQLIFHGAALYIVSAVNPGFKIGNSLNDISLAIIALALINVFIKPLVKIFFLPINFLTFNLFSIIINAGIVWLLTIVVPSVQISAFIFNGFSGFGFIIPEIHFNIIYNYFLVAIILTGIINLLNWISK